MKPFEDRLRHLRKPDEAMAKPTVTEGLVPYQAFAVVKEPVRYLELRPKFPAASECPPYAMISNLRIEWRWHLAIAIIYGKNMVVEIKGKHLEALAQALKEWRVEWIAEFDPAAHARPIDDQAPLIESIEITVPTSQLPENGQATVH